MGSGWQVPELGDLIFYCAMGAVLGGRLGYALFYQPGFYLSNPLAIVRAWEGGMSFHGGLLGVLAACWLYAIAVVLARVRSIILERERNTTWIAELPEVRS